MGWVALSILTAILGSITDTISKFALKNINPYVVAWSNWVFGLIILLPAMYLKETPQLGPHFWTALLLATPLEIAGFVFYYKALKISDLSLVAPLVSLTSIFLFITSFFILGELPNFFGFLGIILIVIGSYWLNLKEKNNGYLAPLLCLWKNKGSRYMMITAIIWSITTPFGKMGVQNSSPLFWGVSIFSLLTITFFPVVLFKSKGQFSEIKNYWPACLAIGLLFGLSMICQYTAYELTLANYVVSLRRFVIILNILAGYYLFKEKDIKHRLLGGAIMVAGVIIIALFS